MQVDRPRVFVSYARADAAFALRLATDLRSVGTNIWLDQLDIPAGNPWDREVEEALRASPCMLVILSPASVASRNVMDEVDFAVTEKKRLLPVYFKPCAIPLRLRRLQYIDFVNVYEEGLNRLLKELAPPTSKTVPEEPQPLAEHQGAPVRESGVATPVPAPVATVIAPTVASTPAAVAEAPYRARGRMAALLLLASVFVLNLGETALEERWSSTVTARGLEFASALHWLEGGTPFENHDVSNVVSVYGFSVAYFFVFPLLVVATACALARQPRPHAFHTYALALAIDYVCSLPFFLLFPVPERWAYPDASAILLSDLWDSRLIEAFRPMSALDNCFPSFHTSMTVILVLCCFVYRVGFRLTTVPLGALVLLSTYSLGVHWAGDVIAGTALGIISVAVACRLVERGAGQRLPAPAPA